MNLKATGNVTDIFTKVERTTNVENSDLEIRRTAETANDNSVKKVDNIEKTAIDVHEYLKNLSGDKKVLEEVLKFINSDLESNNTKVEFSFNEKINQMMVQVTDKNTGEVIRSLPPEHLVKLMERFRTNGTLEGIILSDQI